MKAYLESIPEDKDYVLIGVYTSTKKFRYQIRIPKYFLTSSNDIEEGDEVTINLEKKVES